MDNFTEGRGGGGLRSTPPGLSSPALTFAASDALEGCTGVARAPPMFTRGASSWVPPNEHPGYCGFARVQGFQGVKNDQTGNRWERGVVK